MTCGVSQHSNPGMLGPWSVAADACGGTGQAQWRRMRVNACVVFLKHEYSFTRADGLVVIVSALGHDYVMTRT
ncbi:hypothetical protein [Acetobacter okinawensis]|uniref:hypothetical protein n=1 Tax=Acetobacter okinawensis TaxID=1076594 RepID=UPI000A9BABCA|nr:hypothetical protein [Acetobacter okinawensis]